jgi:hypothetical protein
LQLASPADVDLVREGSGEFFEDVERHILAGDTLRITFGVTFS